MFGDKYTISQYIISCTVCIFYKWNHIIFYTGKYLQFYISNLFWMAIFNIHKMEFIFLQLITANMINIHRHWIIYKPNYILNMYIKTQWWIYKTYLPENLSLQNHILLSISKRFFRFNICLKYLTIESNICFMLFSSSQSFSETKISDGSIHFEGF